MLYSITVECMDYSFMSEVCHHVYLMVIPHSPYSISRSRTVNTFCVASAECFRISAEFSGHSASFSVLCYSSFITLSQAGYCYFGCHSHCSAGVPSRGCNEKVNDITCSSSLSHSNSHNLVWLHHIF